MRCRFFLYILILFLTNQASIMGFRAIAAVCRAVVVSNMVRCQQQQTPLRKRPMLLCHLLTVLVERPCVIKNIAQNIAQSRSLYMADPLEP